MVTLCGSLAGHLCQLRHLPHVPATASATCASYSATVPHVPATASAVPATVSATCASYSIWRACGWTHWVWVPGVLSKYSLHPMWGVARNAVFLSISIVSWFQVTGAGDHLALEHLHGLVLHLIHLLHSLMKW